MKLTDKMNSSHIGAQEQKSIEWEYLHLNKVAAHNVIPQLVDHSTRRLDTTTPKSCGHVALGTDGMHRDFVIC